MDDTEATRQRVDTLKAYELLDTPPEAALDAIVRTVADQAGAPMAMITLIDEHRQWFKAKLGVDVDETPIEHSICAHAIRQHGTFVVPDARLDPRFRDIPSVAAEDGIRFYAGTTLRLANGAAIGTLCVIDREAREGLTEDERGVLEALARRTVAAFEMRRELRSQEGWDAPREDVVFWLDQATGLLDRAAAALEQNGPSVALAELEHVIALLDAQRVAADAAVSA